jgi:hypothetical protein
MDRQSNKKGMEMNRFPIQTDVWLAEEDEDDDNEWFITS